MLLLHVDCHGYCFAMVINVMDIVVRYFIDTLLTSYSWLQSPIFSLAQIKSPAPVSAHEPTSYSS